MLNQITRNPASISPNKSSNHPKIVKGAWYVGCCHAYVISKYKYRQGEPYLYCTLCNLQ